MSEPPSDLDAPSSLDISSIPDDFTTSEQPTTQESVEEKSDVISAVPPTVSVSFTGATVEDLDTPALACLEELQARGKLDGEHAARLKKKYTTLHETLVKSHSNENTLITRAKELSQKLVQQKAILDRADNFPGGQTTEVTQLRQELLQYKNEQAEIDERMEKQQYEIRMLSEEKQLLEKESKRIPNPVEEARKLQEIQTESIELREETEKRLHEISSYRDEVEQKNVVIKEIQTEVDELEHSENALNDDLARLHTIPGNIPKEMASIRRNKIEIEGKHAEKVQYVAELNEEINRQQSLKAKAEAQYNEMMEKIQANRRGEEALRLDMGQLSKDLEQAKEREATLLEDKATVELQLRHRSSEYRMLFDMLSKRTKEKNKEMKALKRADLQLKVVKESFKELETVSRKVMDMNDDSKITMEAAKQRGEDMRNNVDTFRRQLTQQENIEEGVRLHLEHQQREERQLKLQVQHQRDYLHNCSRDNVTMTKLRDQEGRNLRKAMDQNKEIVDTLKTKNGMIEENRKKLKELELQLQDFAKAYEVVKGERNKTHTLIQTTTQLVSEMHEKSKILDNEIEILRSSVASKERLLQKCSIAYSNKVIERDSFHQELSRYKLSQLDLNVVLEQQRGEIHRLNNLINTVEQQMIRLRKRYERSVQERNDQGLQLIERNEEVCIFYERINVQELIVRNADLEMKAREEEIRFLKMELNEINRELAVLQKLEPQKLTLGQKLGQAQAELSEVHEHLVNLEHAAESDLSRARALPGVDPNTGQLRNSMEKAEERLAAVEEHALEKELLYEQVGRLTDWVQRQVHANKTETLQLAKKVNSYQAQIRDTTRKIKALVSQLSMNQAKSIETEQQVKTLSLKLEQAYVRLEQGEAPNEECEREFLKMLQKRSGRRKIGREVEEDEQWKLPDGTYTTAIPRPNAYIPQSGSELPLPKPYGSQAPFKPTLPGTNIRHIQKPKPKPIEI